MITSVSCSLSPLLWCILRGGWHGHNLLSWYMSWFSSVISIKKWSRIIVPYFMKFVSSFMWNFPPKKTNPATSHETILFQVLQASVFTISLLFQVCPNHVSLRGSWICKITQESSPTLLHNLPQLVPAVVTDFFLCTIYCPTLLAILPYGLLYLCFLFLMSLSVIAGEIKY